MAIFVHMEKKNYVHIAAGGYPAFRVADEQMHKIERIKAHGGGRSAASIVREAIDSLYEKYEVEMTDKTKRIKWTRKQTA